MKLGFMQPYFFPYIGYFDLISRTDFWLVFDTAQYIRHGWVNRNRILHPGKGWQYIIVPVKKAPQSTPIRDIQVAEDNRWRQKLIGQMQHYQPHAPYFEPVMDILSECLSEDTGSLLEINVNGLAKACEYIGIPFKPVLFSELNKSLGPIDGPGDWALRAAEAIGAAEYINPLGGSDLFDTAKFSASGIKLSIQSPINFKYDCGKYTFEQNMSIIDVMMWNSPETIRSFLDYRIPIQ